MAIAGGRVGRVILIVIATALLVWVGTIIVLPARSPRKERVMRVQCASNLRQIHQGLLLYCNDAGTDQYPADLVTLVGHGDLHPEVFTCPSSGGEPATGATTREVADHFRSDPERCSYVYVGGTLTARHPADCVVAYEPLANHKGEGMNVLYNDGHVEWVAKGEAERVIAELGAGHNPPRPAMAVSGR